MPSVQINPEKLLMIAHQIRAGELKTLKLKPRVNGKNKGILFADYAVKVGDAHEVPAETTYYRQRVAKVVEQAATAIAAGDNVRFEIAKIEDPERERYTYIFEVR